jgi:hypothetical protein
MGRVIIIAVAVVMGALSVWFLVPTVPLAKVAEVPVSSSLPTSKEIMGNPVVSGGMVFVGSGYVGFQNGVPGGRVGLAAFEGIAVGIANANEHVGIFPCDESGQLTPPIIELYGSSSVVLTTCVERRLRCVGSDASLCSGHAWGAFTCSEARAGPGASGIQR